jgi:hypothetical protein
VTATERPAARALGAPDADPYTPYVTQIPIDKIAAQQLKAEWDPIETTREAAEMIAALGAMKYDYGNLAAWAYENDTDLLRNGVDVWVLGIRLGVVAELLAELLEQKTTSDNDAETTGDNDAETTA